MLTEEYSEEEDMKKGEKIGGKGGKGSAEGKLRKGGEGTREMGGERLWF